LRTIRSKWSLGKALSIAALFVVSGRAWAQSNGPAPAPYQVVVVSMFRHGFEPAEISRPQGPFLLVIRSYDHEGDHAFDAAAADQQALPASIEKDRFHWVGLVDLKPGDHILQDHDRADRRLKITIAP
jgi:hypothetical protein